MIRKFLLLFTFSACALSVYGQQNRSEAFTTAEMNFDGAWYFQKVALNGNTMPAIRVTDQDYAAAGTSAVTDSMLALATQPRIRIAVERKKTFALVGIPAFRKDASGNLQKLQHFNLVISEKETAAASTAGPVATMRLSAPSSALANGSWHKIAIPARGVYKVDYAFVKNNLGTGTISSAAIRLFGNGGTILDENNNAARYDDLTENALDMHDGGDGNFNEGDYFLFYANGPLDWQKDSSKQIFHHRTNLYADSSYYFITLDNGAGLRMQEAPDPGTATTSVNSYNDYALHEKEQRNLGYFGKIWWGEIFGFTGGLSSVQTFSFPSANLVDSVRFEYSLASAATPLVSNAAAFTVKLNGTTIGEHIGLQGIGGTDGDDVGVPVFNSGAIPTSGNSLDFNIQYFKYTADAKAYLDYIEVNMRRKLVMTSGQQLSFRDWRSIGGAGAIARYNIDNAGTAVQVWDVTDPLRPQRINGSSSGSTYSFNQRASDLHEFIATDGTYPAPAYAGKVANQNLHGLGQQDYVIIAHEEYVEAANRLADFHRSNGLRVAVVPVGQVYNEFACGAKDISALRDFLRMFYDRAGTDESQMPKHLLLFGQASYDYKNIVPNNARIVPTYETPESLWANVGYCSDDFFGILDSTEFIDTGNALLDIGVGRLPATTVAEANDMVNKILRYKSPQALGPWRLNNIYVGDNEDGAGNHMMDADSMSKVVLNSSDLYTSVKVYLDNMNTISTPGGQRSPDANKAINDNIYKGTFLFNYSGHGSIYTLSKKRVLTQDDFKNWKNPYKLPVMITATCDFSRFDNPALQSAGEKLMIKGDGGAIALVTTTQVVYAEPNKRFNSAYLKFQFQKKADGWHSFGDAFRISKNSVLDVTSTNSRKFALLGDPALIPDFPRYNVATDSIQEMTDGGTIHADSVKSLGTYQVYGSVRDDAGNVMHDFNGKVNISFYDKPQIISVRTANSGNTYRKYNVQNNLIYKGIATVKNGAFSFSFITPKDINYDFGKGRISYYADNGTTDASGSDASVTVGGFSDNATTDNDGPLVRPFMNDSLFRDGSITGPNSVLYAIISDESGINISGNAVGHDLTAVLDDVVEVPYVLNDYYETAPNTYKRGYVNFPITGLTNGKHTLRVKAWDVFNNSGEGVVHFEVVDGSIVRVQNLRSYPNPFRDITHFVFDHNHPNEPLKATVHIFNTAGSLVSTLEQSFTPTGSRSAEVIWDGTDKGGAKLPAGVYPYRIRIATETNIEDLGYEKVVLIR